MRNDYDITFNLESNENPPKFFDDMDYFTSLFTDINEETLEKFLEEIKDWNKIKKYSYKFVHPIKKKFIGPDRVNLNEVYSFYFISPKLFVVEIHSYGSGFPFADTFVSITQYRFNSNYKYNQNEGIFKFTTSCSLMFTVLFKKSCLFSGKIEDEGLKESEEVLKYGSYEKIKTILEAHNENFNQMFIKLNDENMRKTTSRFCSDIQLMANEQPEIEINEDLSNEIEPHSGQ